MPPDCLKYSEDFLLQKENEIQITRGHVSTAHASFCTLILLSASRLCALEHVSLLFVSQICFSA